MNFLLIKKNKAFTNVLVLFFSIFFYTVNAQNEASNWYFGSRAGITFNTSPPSAITGSQMSALEGCATISNLAGELLFYTDGQTVWNRNHSEMLNGSGLFANASSAQAAIIVSKPNDLGIFYVFTVDSGGQENSGFYYSEIDMSLDNGLGGVTALKNVFLFGNTTEMITAYKSESFDGFWIVTHGLFTNEYLTFKVDEQGVEITPIISTTGFSIGDPVGQLKISPQGDKIAATVFSAGLAGEDYHSVNLSDFDANTGIISNTISLDFEGGNAYGVEFAPDGSKLYVGNGYTFSPLLVQFDLLAGNTSDIQNSKFVIYDTFARPIASMQIGLDERIYVVAVSNDHLDVIENPNELGININYTQNAISLGGNQGTFGLPQFVQSLFSNKIIHEVACTESLVDFNLSNANIESVEWDFGDPTSGFNNFSSNLNTSHTFETYGTYYITATVQSNGAEFEYRKSIFVNPTPIIPNTIELIQCDDDIDGISYFNLTEAESILLDDYENFNFFYYHDFISANEKNVVQEITSSTNYQNTSPYNETIFIRVETSRGCHSVTQLHLIIEPNQIPNDFVLDYYACEDRLDDSNNSDGITNFDFSNATPIIENLFENENVLISYYLNESDAFSEENKISNIQDFTNNFSPYTQNIWVRVDGINDNNCIGISPMINLFVIPSNLTETSILDEYIVCMDNNGSIFNPNESSLPIDTGLSPQNYSFTWFHGTLEDVANNIEETTIADASYSFYFPETEGSYTVQITDLNTGCSTWDTTNVKYSYPPNDINISLNSPFFTPNSTVNISTEGLGVYEYQINNREWQNDNTFSNINFGEHIARIKDIYDCAIMEKPFFMAGYPQFFTPNNDGKNDRWIIKPGDELILTKVSIYNRYGKLLAEFENPNFGWDGTYNGKLLPSSDYWFSVEYFTIYDSNKKKHLGHFTLKR